MGVAVITDVHERVSACSEMSCTEIDLQGQSEQQHVTSWGHQPNEEVVIMNDGMVRETKDLPCMTEYRYACRHVGMQTMSRSEVEGHVNVCLNASTFVQQWETTATIGKPAFVPLKDSPCSLLWFDRSEALFHLHGVMMVFRPVDQAR